MQKNVSNEFTERLKKLDEIKASGIIPYADRFETNTCTKDAVEYGTKSKLREVKEIVENKTDKPYKLAGRLVSFREHGKLTFAHLKDFSGRMQICFMQDLMGEEKYKFFTKNLDIADYIGVTGELFLTKHGEPTLLVYDVKLLAKAMLPLPEKWHGLQNQEQIYRQRYLDLIMNDESMKRMVFRSNLIKVLRKFYWNEGFVEIESPYLEAIASGTNAKPFITHHNALDFDVYLRIAGGELWHKSAIVGGYEKIFEIGKCFRNEGMDPSHLQEFTMVEHYSAFWDYEDNMKFTERMFEYMLKELIGTTKLNVKDREGNPVEVDFKTPWPRIKYAELIEKDSGINILDFSDAKTLLVETKKKGIVIEKAESLGYGNLVDALYKKVSRPKLIQPCFVINHPFSTKPLARRNDSDPRLCDSYQLLVNTWEIVNAYSELVDPIDQRARFESQALAKSKGDEEAMMMNEEYLTTMEHGMPCMSGFGMGIDRLVTLFTCQDNLKDSILFPLMKPYSEA